MRAAASRLASEPPGVTADQAPATAPSLRQLQWGEALRDQQPLGRVERRLQPCYGRLVRSGQASGLSAIECHAVALRVAMLARCHSLARHYRGELLVTSAGVDPIAVAAAIPAEVARRRLKAILDLVDDVADGPHRLRPSRVRALETEGLSVEAIAAVARLVAFVGYQAALFVDIATTLDLDHPET
jgi:uncharacterized protein YciW